MPSESAAPPDLPPLREVIARYGLSARKSLGQHFLFDRNLTDRIARAAGPLDPGSVIEVGPGPGGLTRSLLRAGARQVVAVEKDRRCLGALAELSAAFPGRLEIVEADALDCRLADLGAPPRRIVANLPYNVATALLVDWLTQLAARPDLLASMVLMFQKEVGQRIAAPPGDKSYGRLSVLSQWLCDNRILFDVSPGAFTPPPQVTSSVVQLLPRAEPLAPADPAALQAVTAAAFGQRRKMLRQSLKTLAVPVPALLAETGIDPTVRAEQLSVADFCALARALSVLRQS